MPDLSGLRSAHLIGVGGAGMSGIATLLLSRGVTVTGSDLKEGAEVRRLRKEGATVEIGHRGGNVGTPDAVIVSTAVRNDNPELREASDREIPVYIRAQVLAALMRERRGVAVSGTHGKTTTTSMLAVILEAAGLDPTYVIGGDLNESGSNARAGAGEIFLAEADESDGSFLLLDPEIAIVTNVDADHLDFYRDEEDVRAAFVAFVERSEHLIACVDDPGVADVLKRSAAAAITYGSSEGADVRFELDSVSREGTHGRVSVGGEELALSIPVPGRHHLANATGSLAAALALGVERDVAVRALAAFGGVRRRFERRGGAAGARFVDDYAHHPAEIRATLDSARADGAARVVAVFQPHRFSRTEALGEELGASLATADVVVVTDVYAAGETPIPGVTARLVLQGLLEEAPRKRVIYLPRRIDVPAFLAREVRDGDLVLTLGAGDVTMVSEETIARLSA